MLRETRRAGTAGSSNATDVLWQTARAILEHGLARDMLPIGLLGFGTTPFTGETGQRRLVRVFRQSFSSHECLHSLRLIWERESMPARHNSARWSAMILALGLVLVSGGRCLAARYVPIDDLGQRPRSLKGRDGRQRSG